MEGHYMEYQLKYIVSIFLLTSGGILCLILISSLLAAGGYSLAMQRGLDRGYTERCLGTSVLHWKGECPNGIPN